MVVVPGRTSDPLESTKYHACHANHTGRAAATQLVAGGVWLVVGGWWLVVGGGWSVVGWWLVVGWLVVGTGLSNSMQSRSPDLNSVLSTHAIHGEFASWLFRTVAQMIVFWCLTLSAPLVVLYRTPRRIRKRRFSIRGRRERHWCPVFR